MNYPPPGQQPHMMQYGMNRQQPQMTQAQRQAQAGRGRGMPSPVAVPAPPVPQSPAGNMGGYMGGGRGYTAPRGGQAGAQPKASPRAKQNAAPANVPAPPPPSTPKATATATPKPGAPAPAAAAQPPEDVKPVIPAQHPIDFEFLGLISEILRLVEEGFSDNSEQVRIKVEELQHKFMAARAGLEAMDGAELSPQMQEEMHDLYQKRLTHLNAMMANYSELSLFSEAAESSS